MNSTQKLGFWAVFALVLGSQIGSGVFMMPAHLAPYGLVGIAGWLISACGAVSLALVFAGLAARFTKTGGPHVYVEQAFGRNAAFFTGWTYWVISWVSSTVVVAASIGYLTAGLSGSHSTLDLILEIALLLAITALNFRGVSAAGRAEFVLTLLKFIPLALVPLAALRFFDTANFNAASDIAQLDLTQQLGRVALLTFWGFIGIESATTPAESVENPRKTIPLAVITGTICVALIYILNSVALMGAMPGALLAKSQAPYADVVRFMWGGNWHVAVSVIAAIVCIGTLNAWTLTSGQIVLGLAKDGLVPTFLGKTNRFGAPYVGLLVSTFIMIPILFLTAQEGIAAQVLAVIDISVTAFLFVYALSAASFIKLLLAESASWGERFCKFAYALIALLFCCWIIFSMPLQNVLLATLFSASGLPIYVWLRRQHH